MASSTEMAVDQPKLNVDLYLTEALSAAPQELQPFFEAFSQLYQRKSVIPAYARILGDILHHIDTLMLDYGTS